MRTMKFRICYTAQDGSKTIHYSDDMFRITMDGEVLENYGTLAMPVWEVPFDVAKPPVLEQFTGCIDKNGKEIYEGDIVKYCRSVCGNTGEEEWSTGNGVTFERGCFWVGDRKGSGSWMTNDYKPGDPALMYWQDPKWLEVIGNIHEQ